MRILIVRIGAMGDVLHAMPAVAALRARHPQAFIGWALDPRWSELLQIAGDFDDLLLGLGPTAPRALVDRWYSVPTQAWRQHPFAPATVSEVSVLRDVLQEERFDLCVDLQGSIKSAVVGRISGAPMFVGPEEPREALARRMYKVRVPMTARHVVPQACELLGAATSEQLTPAPVTLPMDAEDELWADALLTGGESGQDQPVCLLAPTAGWGAKQWPAERFGAVAAAMGRADYRVLVNAASSSGDVVAAEVVATSEGFATAVPSTLGQLIALTRRAAVVIAGDTGPLHLAAALGRPVVGIYGPTSPVRNGPWGTRSRVLRDDSSVTSHKRVAEPEPGMLRISAQEVFQAAREVAG